MCAGDDRNCPDFELHRQRLLDDLDAERRSFLKSAFAATGGAAALTAGGMSLVSPAAAAQSTGRPISARAGTSMSGTSLSCSASPRVTMNQDP